MAIDAADIMSETVVLYSVIYYIYIPGALGPCFHYWCSVYGICKWSDTLWPVGRVRLFADYSISLLSLCRLICRHWTTKMIVRYMLPNVYQRLRQFSQLSFIRYMALCIFSLSNYPVMIVRIGTLSYYHHQIESMNHWPLFRVRSWNNGMRCMSYCVLIMEYVKEYLALNLVYIYIIYFAELENTLLYIYIYMSFKLHYYRDYTKNKKYKHDKI